MEEQHINQSLSHVAKRIKGLGLALPVVALLEMHKPLRSVFHATALLVQPTIHAVVSPHAGSLLVTIFESPELVERLISLLEAEDSNSYERC